MDNEEKDQHLKILGKIREEYYYANNLSSKAKASARKNAKDKTTSLTKDLRNYLNKNRELQLLALDTNIYDIHASFKWDDFFRTDIGIITDDLIIKLNKL